jgi:hypothetical protein
MNKIVHYDNLTMDRCIDTFKVNSGAMFRPPLYTRGYTNYVTFMFHKTRRMVWETLCTVGAPGTIGYGMAQYAYEDIIANDWIFIPLDMPNYKYRMSFVSVVLGYISKQYPFPSHTNKQIRKCPKLVAEQKCTCGHILVESHCSVTNKECCYLAAGCIFIPQYRAK